MIWIILLLAVIILMPNLVIGVLGLVGFVLGILFVAVLVAIVPAEITAVVLGLILFYAIMPLILAWHINKEMK